MLPFEALEKLEQRRLRALFCTDLLPHAERLSNVDISQQPPSSRLVYALQNTLPVMHHGILHLHIRDCDVCNM